jgi:hypothetical protein
MVGRWGLKGKGTEFVKENTAVLTIRDLQDTGAIVEVERHAMFFRPDIICVNPLTSYLSQEVYKDESINKFLQTELVPMLDRIQASAIVVHHPRNRLLARGQRFDCFELQYGASGMASLTNAPRGNALSTHIDEMSLNYRLAKD